MFTSFALASTLGTALDAAFFGFDMTIFRFFGSIQSDFLTFLAKIFTAMGSPVYIILIAVGALVLCFFKKTRKIGLAIVFAVIIGTLLVNVIIKPMALRIRPYNTLQNIPEFWAWYQNVGALCESDYCFPSGHSTAAFEVATALFIYFFRNKHKVVAWIFPVLALLTSASRVYLHVHYATDVIAGIILGIAAGILGTLVASAICKAISRRKIDDILDLERRFKKKITKGGAFAVIAVVWVLIFGISYLLTVNQGGADTVRCAYDREYNCQNEAEVGSKKYPAINGKYYCKLHWKQLNEQFQETGSVDDPAMAPFSSSSEPVLNTDLFTFYNDPAITSFKNNFASQPPRKMIYRNGANEITVTDAALIKQVFEALKGVQVGGEHKAEEEEILKNAGTYYTFYLDNEDAITIGIEFPYVISYNGKLYDITDDNGAFSIIPDDYFEGASVTPIETTVPAETETTKEAA